MRFKVNPLDPTGLSPIEDSVVIASTGGGASAGVSSISKSGDTKLTGDVTLSAGTNVTLTQSGQDISIAATSTGTLPVGGTAGQILSKIDATDYNTQWIDNYSNVMKQEVKLDEAVTKGQVVYVSGANGTNVLVKKADNSSDATSATTIGLVETTGVLNDIVNVVTEGLIKNIDTSAAGAAGDPVWLGTNGNLIYGLANEPVAPAHIVYLGTVVRKSATVGEIYVHLHNGWELNELHNVAITSVTNNDTLAYESATGLWKNKTIPTVLGYTPEDVANKDTTTTLGTSDTKYPSQKAVKTYVDTQDATKVTANSAITGATKTKITYDAKGLVTAGEDATTADIADSTNKRYVTDANLTVIGNTSGTNTGDETQSTIKTKLGAATTSVDGYLTSTDWNTFNGKQASLGFTAENVANKSTTTTLGTSDTLYPTQNAVKTYVDTSIPTGTINAYSARTAPSGWLNCDGSAISRTTYANLFAIISPSLGTMTVTIASPAVVTKSSHGLSTGDSVYITTTGALPTGLTTNTLYFVIRIDANTFNLATTRANAYAGTKINTSGTESGTHTIRDCPHGLGDGSTTFNVPDLRGRVAAGMDTTGGTAASRMTLARSQGAYGNQGASGGAESHTLVTAEMPSHSHTLDQRITGTANAGNESQAYSAGTLVANNYQTKNTGSDTAHNNVQPTLLVNYIIKT